ncbi:MAG: hypothetical protein FWC16_04760 [Defluviitaleaceae bacterium]|nr:hypothetical protein [Defluviitaleaceae bacterium]MCL2274218.1 hypothetical protein [Defluviitaleaceae bacterium]
MIEVPSKSPTLALLSGYRHAIWRKAALEAVPGVGQKALEPCIEQICLTHELVATLQTSKRVGEKLYWIIFASYLTDRQPCDVDEILSDIARLYQSIPRRTYFRLKARAIEIMDECLCKMNKNRKVA